MIKNIVFDVGRVLIHWDAKHLYRKVFKTDEEIDKFLEEFGFWEWNLSMDKGKPANEAIAEKQKQFPHLAKEIEMYHTHWEEAVPCAIEENAKILKELKAKGYPVYALTNFASDKFKLSKKRFDFLNIFDGTVVSAEEKMLKPYPKFFMVMCNRYDLKPEESLFIDDSEANIETAKNLGFKTILYKYPDCLRTQLKELNIEI